MSQGQKKLWDAYSVSPTPELRSQIVKQYLPLVRYVAGRMALTPPPGLDYEDFFSFGAMGLLDAIDRFDPELGFSFQTFAVPRIRGAILDELRRFDWISRTGREKLQRLEQTMQQLVQKNQPLDDKRVMAELGMDEKSYKELLEIAGRSYVVSLDEVLTTQDSDMQREFFIEDDAPSPAEIVEKNEDVERVQAALSSLPERQQLLLTLYYHEGLTLKEIGNVLGVTESRVSQIHAKALASLRALLLAAQP